MEDKRFTTLQTRAIIQTDLKGNFKCLFKTMAEAIYETGIPFHSLQRLIKLKKPLNGMLYRQAKPKDLLEIDRAINQINNAQNVKEQKAREAFDEIFDGFSVPVEVIPAPVREPAQDQLQIDVINLDNSNSEISSFEKMLQKAKENFNKSEEIL